MQDSRFLRLEGLSKRFGDVEVLDRLSLEIGEGEILALLGLSGSGKTTALRLVAGFETPDAGRIVVAGDDVTNRVPARRDFGMVFQHYALFPHMTVGRNIAFGLESRGWSASRIDDRVEAMLRLVDLEGFAPRRVDAVSGGQQQRVALARALAPEPRVLLLDEPLSNLDPSLRERTRRELAAAIKSIGITTLLVTHEQEEAFDVGDRVAVLDAGRLAQVGRPEDLYSRPATRFVATFVGRAAILPGRVVSFADGRFRVALDAGGEIEARASESAAELATGSTVDVVARPERLRLVDPSDGAASGGNPSRDIRGTIEGERFTGPLRYALVSLSGSEHGIDPPRIEVAVDRAVTVGAAVGIAPVEDAPLPTLFPRDRP